MHHSRSGGLEMKVVHVGYALQCSFDCHLFKMFTPIEHWNNHVAILAANQLCHISAPGLVHCSDNVI